MAEIKRVRFSLSDITQGGAACVNPTVKFEAPQGIDVVCPPGSDYIEVIISPDADSHCVTFTIDCEDCDTCPPQTFTECFCVTAEDCQGPCDECINGRCVSTCPEDKICVGNGVCGDCDENNPCTGGRVCVGNECVCPAERPFFDERTQKCVACNDENPCGPCEVCDGINCVPKHK